MSRLLVTGGLGFIGSAVVDAARRAGWSVRILDSVRADVHGAAHGAGTVRPVVPDGTELVIGDITDPATVATALEGVDAVSHQAAKVGLGVNIHDAPDYVHANAYGTAVLLSEMAAADVTRLVLASSMVVYGEGLYRDGDTLLQAPPRTREDLDRGRFEPRSPRTGAPLAPELIHEDRACDPRNTYATTKLTQELLAEDWARTTGSTVAMLRYHNVYGPHMPQGTPYAGVASLFRSALERGEAPRVFEDGGQRRDFIHVDDVATANVAALGWTAQTPPGTARAFNIASGRVHTIGEFATTLAAAVGGPGPVVTGEYRLGDVRHITASARRAEAELGWHPRVDFATGVAEFAAAPLRRKATV